MIDPKEAPDGFEAVKQENISHCKGCHFDQPFTGECYELEKAGLLKCDARHRKDGQNVIFKKKEKV